MTTLKLGGIAFMSHQMKLVTAAVAGLLASAPAFATNGYALHGIGLHSKGMGGASIAFPQDAVSVGQNPAASAAVGNRFDVGVDVFRPIRDAEICGECALQDPPPVPNFQHYDGSESKWFFIPEIAYSQKIDAQMSWGISLFGNGGMNTDYGSPGIPLFNTSIAGFDPNTGAPIYQPNPGDTGINLQQMFIVPTFAYKVNEQHSLGIGLNIVAQGFKAFGLDAFASTYPNVPAFFGPLAGAGIFSNSPGSVTDNGTDWAWGWGVRVGWNFHFHHIASHLAIFNYISRNQEFEHNTVL
jgi:long-chain fatty acid transport protein